MYTIYTDGACLNNPGHCGLGVVILDENEKIISTISEYLGDGTNNIAEIMAIYRAIRNAKELNITKCKIYTDSKLCIGWFNKKTSKKEHIQIILDKCLKDMDDIEIEFEWVKGHDGDKWNELADTLANQSVDNIVTKIQDKDKPKKTYYENDDNDLLYLNCPFAEKDEVKKLGARWNVGKKKWTVKDTPENQEKFSKWM
jgi:ribonuclease HI